MPGRPELRIVRGSPTPEEEHAIERAVLELWQKAQGVGSQNPWVLAARAEGIRTVQAFRGPHAWRLSSRLAP